MKTIKEWAAAFGVVLVIAAIATALVLLGLKTAGL